MNEWVKERITKMGEKILKLFRKGLRKSKMMESFAGGPEALLPVPGLEYQVQG